MSLIPTFFLIIFALFFLTDCSFYPDNADHSSKTKTLSPYNAAISFIKANPAYPLPVIFERKVDEALALLDKAAKNPKNGLRAELAEETLNRIREGAVLLDEITSALPQDLYHMCRDLHISICKIPLKYPTDFIANDELRKSIVKNYAGYMWGNRIYFTVNAKTDPQVLASVLVHETNHVLNRSECHYYSDTIEQTIDDRQGYLEEYRAFVAECAFIKGSEASASVCHDFASRWISSGYSFKADASTIVGSSHSESLAEKIFKEHVYGWLIPNRPHWPKSFSDCM
ncbi:MAG: hypothetical protein HQK54_06835 [Oligoflexales bacterium]|nr:hypothetical protein [Oligoflexales bacterium]